MIKQEFTIDRIGEAKIDNPIRMSSVHGHGSADYVEDTDKIYLNIDHDESDESKDQEDVLELAGPRKKIYFNPAHVHAAICTCGGICPGLNNVIRSVVSVSMLAGSWFLSFSVM